jgi:hypothetical protein
VRPDFVVASPTLEGARKFNAVLNSREKQFASTPFGQRVAEIYGWRCSCGGSNHGFRAARLAAIPAGASPANRGVQSLL